MVENPTISIIVPVYNAEKFLDECLSSITAQSFCGFEVLLIDDGSTDGSSGKCDEWQERDHRINVIHKKNGGVCEARNVGVENARGEWILFVDADDRINEDLLSNLLNAQSEKQVDGAGTGYITFDHTVDEATSEEAEVLIANKKRYTKLRGGEYVWGTLYNRNLIEQANLRFDVSLLRHEEAFWNSIYALYCRKYAFVSPPQYYYRRNPTSLMHSIKANDTGVRDWLLARDALDRWKRSRNLSPGEAIRLRSGEIHCEKNCFAECLSSGLGYGDFKMLCETAGIQKAFWNSASYFKFFEIALRIRRKLKG